MLKYFAIGLVGRLFGVAAWFVTVAWVFTLFRWQFGVAAFSLWLLQSWCQYVSRQTIRVEEVRHIKWEE